MLQNFLIAFSIIISNYCVKECLKPTINGCLAPWKILLHMITGQKLIWTNTEVLQLSRKPGFSECHPDSITSQNNPVKVIIHILGLVVNNLITLVITRS